VAVHFPGYLRPRRGRRGAKHVPPSDRLRVSPGATGQRQVLDGPARDGTVRPSQRARRL